MESKRPWVLNQVEQDRWLRLDCDAASFVDANKEEGLGERGIEFIDRFLDPLV
jgi:hypothetical protein